jgi:hypothetical protein
VLRMVLALDGPTSAEGLTEPSTTVDTQPYFEGPLYGHHPEVGSLGIGPLQGCDYVLRARTCWFTTATASVEGARNTTVAKELENTSSNNYH